MNEIFERVCNVDPNNSEAVKETVVTFVQQLQQNCHTYTIKWLQTLQDVIHRFPKYCMSQRNNIEAQLAEYLDSEVTCYVIEAAKCEHLLLQVRPLGDKIATPKTSWRDQMSILCEAAHDLVGDIFVHAKDIYKTHKLNSTSEKPQTVLTTKLWDRRPLALDTDANKESALCRKLHNILIFIQAMLVEEYPLAKPVRPQVILDVIIRTLNVTSGDTKNVDYKNVASLKVQALRTLDAIIHCLRSNLIPYSPLVFKLTMQTLKWTTDNIDIDYTKVRIQGYRTLSLWLTVLHNHKWEGGGGCLEEDFLAHIVQDVVPVKRTMQINVKVDKNLSKKAKRKLTNAMLMESNLAPTVKTQQCNRFHGNNEELITAALDCTEMFLLTCGFFLKPTTHKALQEHIVGVCLKLEGYGEPYCRVLNALRKSTANGPTHYCLDIFSRLIHSNNQQISRFSSQVLLDIRMHLHSSPPSLHTLMVERVDDKPSNRSKGKLSHRNVAALQELLGKDRFNFDEASNSENVVEEEEEQDNTDADDEQDSDDEQNQSNDEETTSKKSKYNNVEENHETLEISDNEIETHDLTQNTEDNDVQIIESPKNYIENPIPLHDMPTQMAIVETNDAVDGSQNSEHSIEVAYDYPNSAKETTTRFVETDNVNLPCTDETDDVELNCGQDVTKTPEATINTDELGQETNKIDAGIHNNFDVGNHNNYSQENGVEEITEPSKAKTTDGELTVEEMLADFVDEAVENPINK